MFMQIKAQLAKKAAKAKGVSRPKSGKISAIAAKEAKARAAKAKKKDTSAYNQVCCLLLWHEERFETVELHLHLVFSSTLGNCQPLLCTHLHGDNWFQAPTR